MPVIPAGAQVAGQQQNGNATGGDQNGQSGQQQQQGQQNASQTQNGQTQIPQFSPQQLAEALKASGAFNQSSQTQQTGTQQNGTGDSDENGDGQQAERGAALPNDPEKLKAEILRLRDENQSARKTTQQKAADEARNEMATQILMALGLIKEGDGQQQIDSTAAIAAAKSAQRELAVFKASSAHGADPVKLLDSRRFMQSIESLDPTDEAGIGAAIKKAVDENASYKSVQMAGTSSADHSGGSGENRTSRKPLPMAEAVANTLKLS